MNLDPRGYDGGDWACLALGIVLAYCLAAMTGLL